MDIFPLKQRQTRDAGETGLKSFAPPLFHASYSLWETIMTLRKAYASAGRRFPPKRATDGCVRRQLSAGKERGGGSGWCAQASLQHS